MRSLDVTANACILGCMSASLLSDIECFLRETGMGEYRFGLLAVKNGRLVERMRSPGRSGRPGRVWPETEALVRQFMTVERARRASLKSPEAAE